MLSLQDVSLSFGEREILNKISFSLNDYDKVALVGPNGAGKTTLLNLIKFGKEHFTGRIIRPKGTRISYVPQHLELQEDQQAMTVYNYILEARGLYSLRMRLDEIEEQLEACLDSENLTELILEQSNLIGNWQESDGFRSESDIIDLMAGLDLDIDFDQPVDLLSGGYKTRLMIAKLLYEQSDILLLDEPTNHIEGKMIEWLGSLLKKTKKTILVVSHDPAFLDIFVNKVVALDSDLKTARVYPGNYSHYLQTRMVDRLSQTRVSVKINREILRQQNLIRRTTQSQSKLKHSREKVVKKLQHNVGTAVRHKDVKISFSVGTPLRRDVILVREISKAFSGKQLFSKISISIKPNDRLAIIGPNGVGKTTLLKIMLKRIDPDHGKVVHNSNLQIGYYTQEQDDLVDSNSILSEVKSYCANITRLRAVLAHFLFSAERLDQIVGTLSRGERARLALCKIVLQKPNLLLLDEPTNHLDVASKSRLATALQQYEGAIVMASHNFEVMASIGVSTALVLPSGKFVSINSKGAVN